MSIRVLVTDPDESLLAVCEQSLTQHGFRVFTAATGADCLQKLREYVPHVLVLEPELPDALDERVIELVRDAARRRGHTGVDGAGLRVTKKALATKRGRGPNNSPRDPNCSPRKSPLARSSNAHCRRIPHRGRDVMQSYRNRRTKPDSKCCGRTVHIQGGRNLQCKR